MDRPGSALAEMVDVVAACLVDDVAVAVICE